LDPEPGLRDGGAHVLQSRTVSGFRLPALSHNTTSLLWAIGFGVYMYLLGRAAIGWTHAISFVIAAVAGFGIFLFVRACGEDEPRRR
jgi:hypothetical protein